MAFQLIQDDVVREFRLYAPIGWPYWVAKAAAEGGRNGLPLVVALHGGGQDPEQFSDDWPFHTLINPTSSTNWEDRFFVLYPHGFATTMLADQPLRGWNTGFAGESIPVPNDVAFISKAVRTVENLLQRELQEIGLNKAPIDVDRRFLFGYSMGGMMAYKLAHELPDQFAALWVMSSAIGGRAHDGRTPTVTNDAQGTHKLSLFAHHGDQDVVVPPGPGLDPTGTQINSIAHALYQAAGMPTTNADDYVGSVRNLNAAIEIYKLHNDCEPTAFSSSTTEADIGGGTGSQQYVFRQAGGAPNPEVIVYRDPVLEHTGLTATGAPRYFDQADVWEFFKSHPRV